MYTQRLILLLAFFCSILFSHAQNITKGEYFFDKDPGIGKGKSIKVQTAGTIVNIVDSVSVTGLVQGFHLLCIRFKNANNYWSLFQSNSFYIENETVADVLPAIGNAEYFIGKDPGVGHGTPIQINTSDTSVIFSDSILVNAEVPATDTLFVRVKNILGKWGLVNSTVFTIPLDTTDDDRDGLAAWEEYIYGTDPKIFDYNGDGLADGVNVFVGLNPKAPDTDGDGISNIQETINGTSPVLADTDQDGVSDNLDAFPLDPFRTALPIPDGSHNIPVITLQEPF